MERLLPTTVSEKLLNENLMEQPMEMNPPVNNVFFRYKVRLNY